MTELKHFVYMSFPANSLGVSTQINVQIFVNSTTKKKKFIIFVQ